MSATVREFVAYPRTRYLLGIQQKLLNNDGAQLVSRSQMEAKSVDYFTKVFEA